MDRQIGLMERGLRPLAILAMAAGSVVLPACSEASDHEAAPITPVPTTSTTGPTEVLPPMAAENEACVRILDETIPVRPESRLTKDNADDINDQLQAMMVAKDPDARVSFDNIIDAGAIVANSLYDPAYASALTWVNTVQQGPLNADSLFAQNFGDHELSCLTDDQLQKAKDLYHALVDGLAPKAGRQMSAAAREAYEEFVDFAGYAIDNVKEFLESSR